jgi:prophage regulatory protein
MDSTRMLRLPGVLALTGLSKSSLYRLEAAGAFPERLRLTERCSAWRESEILSWLAARPRAQAVLAQPERRPAP